MPDPRVHRLAEIFRPKKETLDRLSMGQAYADAETFRAMMKAQNDYFRQLVPKLNIKA